MFKNLEDIPLRVLVVDDELQIGEFISDFLIEKGYEVFFADNGDDALLFVKRARPHIALLDIRMTGMNGLEVLKHIKEIDPKVGVIMITALQEEELGREALKLGASDYINKPIDFEYLDTSLMVKLSAMLD